MERKINDMSDLDLDDLGNLETEDLQKVSNLINKLMKKKEGVPRTTIKKHAKKKARKTKATKKTKRQPKKLEDKAPTTRKISSRSRQSRTPGQDSPNRMPNKGRQTRVQSIDVDGVRPNLFLGSEFENLHKADSKLDQKLTGNNQPEQRRVPVQYVEVECAKCGKIFEELNTKIQVIEGEVKNICHRCSTNR